MCRKKIIVAGLLLASVTLQGCKSGIGEVAVIEKEPYERIIYDGEPVCRGDLTPVTTVSVKQNAMEIINYSASSEELILDKVYVSAGDKVKEGDLLVSFRSESIEQQMRDRQSQIDQNLLMIDYYQEMMDINPKLDYNKDIKRLREDNGVYEAYKSELQQKLDFYQIRATKDGTITYVNEYVSNGYLINTRNIIRQVCGSGEYLIQTLDKHEFKVGDIYTATLDDIDYELEVIEVTYDETASKKIMQNVVLKPMSDMSLLSDAAVLELTIEEETLKDVLYIDKKYIKKFDEEYCVFVVDKNGYLERVQVEIDSTVGDYVIIQSGLSLDDEVFIK